MNKIRVLSFVDQAMGLIEKELSKKPVHLGEIPDINIGEIVGRALDFLRQNNVPVRGYQSQGIFIVLENDSGGMETSLEVPILESVSIQENLACLDEAIREFTEGRGVIPSQHVKINIKFLYDESQITD